MNPDLDRRTFLGAGAAGLGYFFTATAASAQRTGRKPNETLQVAGIGVGGKGGSDIDQAGKLGEVVALCDIDEGTLKGKAEKFSSARKFYDFRKMYDEMARHIDAVTVSTPDHSAHSVFECRVLKDAARQHNVCTQMGNQGSAENGLRRAVELVQSGIIGDVKEAHVWTNRPIWPQAPKVTKRPEKSDPWPDSLHWDEFLAGAPLRPFAKDTYHSFKWRGWLDFGTGAIGDMACHTANMAFRALKLAYPTTISAESGEVNNETFPGWAHVTLKYPDRGNLPPVTLHWYEGHRDGKLVLPPEDLQAKVLSDGKKLPSSGSILVGEKGILYSPDDYGARFFITPKELVDGKTLDKPETLPSNGKGDQGMKDEWYEAIKAGKPEIAYSNFDIASLLTESFLLGNVAIRTGKTLEWDGPGLRVTNVPEANRFIQTEYRRGWEVTRA